MSWNEEIKKQLKYCGEQVFIADYVKILHPQEVILHDRVRIDPFTLITTQLEVFNNVQICSHVVIGGGKAHKITLNDWTFIGYGSQLFCGSEDYSGKYGPVNDFWGSNKVFHGDITFKKYSGVASQCIVMPGIILPEGCTIGAQSLVFKQSALLEWFVHKGTPCEPYKPRFKDDVYRYSTDLNFLKDRS